MKEEFFRKNREIDPNDIDILPLNLCEAEKILQRNLKTYQDIKEGAEEILTSGIKSVLITDSHFNDNDFSHDYWASGKTAFWLSNKRFLDKNFQEKNAALHSVIKRCLALGYEIKDAIVIAKMYVNRAIRKSITMKADSEIILDSNWPEEEIDLPYLTSHPITESITRFQLIDRKQLGLYPIIDSSNWLTTLLPLDIKTVQLRIKNKQGFELENEIKLSIALAKKYHANLFINDYWEMAIRYGAYGVHLGQKDLDTANIAAIRQARLRLGISTHCYYEVAHAHAFKPSYIACGPIFETTSKVMSFPAQGISQLKCWRRTLNYPLVAIGGIDIEKLPDVLATNVDGIAMISAITQAKDPITATKNLMAMVNQHVTYNR